MEYQIYHIKGISLFSCVILKVDNESMVFICFLKLFARKVEENISNKIPGVANLMIQDRIVPFEHQFQSQK